MKILRNTFCKFYQIMIQKFNLQIPSINKMFPSSSIFLLSFSSENEIFSLSKYFLPFLLCASSPGSDGISSFTKYLPPLPSSFFFSIKRPKIKDLSIRIRIKDQLADPSWLFCLVPFHCKVRLGTRTPHQREMSKNLSSIVW